MAPRSSFGSTITPILAIVPFAAASKYSLAWSIAFDGMQPTLRQHGQFDRCFELFPRLKERQNQAAGSLSGGEQQMLAVSRALMSRPRLLLVDELSLGLAPVIAERLYSALRALCDEGLSVVMVEQFHLVAVGFSDKQYVMEKGRFVKVTEQMAEGRRRPTSARGASSRARGRRSGDAPAFSRVPERVRATTYGRSRRCCGNNWACCRWISELVAQ